MFAYKDKEFYTNYFNSLEDFELVQEFDLSRDDDEKNLYIGMIKAKDCIHPLSIRVEIPVTFPHNKLVFRTLSLSGYPHLIHTGEVKHGDWFCLNTPFGETADNQLELEMYRLREWIKRQLREELPAHIKDPKFSAALQRANTYGWENVDEVNEFRKDAKLTFLGDFQHENFKENKGFLHCIKTEDRRFFVVRNKEVSNFELPYIIVDEFPSEIKILEDVISLGKYYEWDDDVLTHILPEFNMKYEWRFSNISYNEDFDENQALRLLDDFRASLSNDASEFKVTTNNKTILRSINNEEKVILQQQIDELCKNVRANHGYGISYARWFDTSDISIDDIINDQLTPEQRARLEEEERAEWEWNRHSKGFHYFALGFRQKEKVCWYMCYTNRASFKSENESIDISLCKVGLERPFACGMCLNEAQRIEEKQFFGRGVFSKSLINKKIAIVGLGAIGSMVAESLARSGVTAIGLWDNDLVEPGNICRSTFRIQDVGENKGRSIKKHLIEINPYVKIEEIKAAGTWSYYIPDDVNHLKYIRGSFYDNINYDSQKDAILKISDYDLIIDCTGSNELLHFISYAVTDKDIISLCITNHAQNLLMFSNRDGNPFELRKAYLSKIEQDTKNFYIEGTGCYSPTFLATNSSIAALVNMAIGMLNDGIESNDLHSVILSYDKRGIVADQLMHYKLNGYDITMTISSETMMDGEDIPESETGVLGFVFGSYSADGKQIMVTHIVPAECAEEQLEDAYKTSQGIIDYIGDFMYSGAESGTFPKDALSLIESKALNPNINTNNPILAARNPEGTLSFFLYLNGELVPFEITHA